jgi:hypothetical protein
MAGGRAATCATDSGLGSIRMGTSRSTRSIGEATGSSLGHHRRRLGTPILRRDRRMQTRDAPQLSVPWSDRGAESDVWQTMCVGLTSTPRPHVHAEDQREPGCRANSQVPVRGVVRGDRDNCKQHESDAGKNRGPHGVRIQILTSHIRRLGLRRSAWIRVAVAVRHPAAASRNVHSEIVLRWPWPGGARAAPFVGQTCEDRLASRCPETQRREGTMSIDSVRDDDSATTG